MYLVSNSFSASRLQGRESSLHPRGKPLYPIPTIWFWLFTMLRLMNGKEIYHAPTCVLGSSDNTHASPPTLAAHRAETRKTHKVLIPADVVFSFLHMEWSLCLHPIHCALADSSGEDYCDRVRPQLRAHVYSNNDTQKHPHKGIPQRLGNILDRKRMVLVFEEGCFVRKQPSVGLSQFNCLT